MSDLSQDIIVIPEETALSIFVDKANIEPYIDKVREAVSGFSGSVDTAKGRKEIASMAFRVSKIKTYIETVGKNLAAEQKEIPKKIDDTRKYARDTLDELAAEVRRPLDEWEAAEKARIEKHTATLTMLDTFTRGEYSQTIEAIKANLSTVFAIEVGPQCEEFEPDYAKAKAAAEKALGEALERAEKAEDDRLELERLRAAEAERAERDRIERIKHEAAEKARQQAEQAAQAAIAKAEAQAREERDAAHAREEALMRDAERALQEAKDTEDRIRREAAEKEEQEARAALAREADTKHRGAVNRAALAAFVEGGIDEETAKKVIALIAKKMIPAIVIQY